MFGWTINMKPNTWFVLYDGGTTEVNPQICQIFLKVSNYRIKDVITWLNNSLVKSAYQLQSNQINDLTFALPRNFETNLVTQQCDTILFRSMGSKNFQTFSQLRSSIINYVSAQQSEHHTISVKLALSVLNLDQRMTKYTNLWRIGKQKILDVILHKR